MPPIELLAEFAKTTEALGPWAAALTVVLAVLTAGIAKRLESGAQRSFLLAAASVVSDEDEEFASRLQLVRSVRARYESAEKWNRTSNNVLRFAQYIIGGLLATSVVQSTFSAETASVLGALVLISSLIHQQYRPDIKEFGAKQRVLLLRALEREVEDMLFDIRNGSPSTKSVSEIRRYVSNALARVEQSELMDLQAQNSIKHSPQPRGGADALQATRHSP